MARTRGELGRFEQNHILHVALCNAVSIPRAMLGNFKCGYTFEDLLVDITICSSLGHERVYLYNWGSFIDEFGLDDLKDLKPYDSYTIRYNILDVINRFIYWHGLDWGNIIIGALV